MIPNTNEAHLAYVLCARMKPRAFDATSPCSNQQKPQDVTQTKPWGSLALAHRVLKGFTQVRRFSSHNRHCLATKTHALPRCWSRQWQSWRWRWRWRSKAGGPRRAGRGGTGQVSPRMVNKYTLMREETLPNVFKIANFKGFHSNEGEVVMDYSLSIQ